VFSLQLEQRNKCCLLIVEIWIFTLLSLSVRASYGTGGFCELWVQGQTAHVVGFISLCSLCCFLAE
jgi:hypothetical protein